MFADCDYDICLAADKAHSSNVNVGSDGILRDSEIMVSLWAVVADSEIMFILIIDAAIQICRQY